MLQKTSAIVVEKVAQRFFFVKSNDQPGNHISRP
jgi:hypothetical protein